MILQLLRLSVPVAKPLRGTERLTALVEDESRRVWRALLRLGVAPDALDDATQEVFIVAARRLDDVTPGSERAFLHATAVRVAANYRRAQRARREQPLEEFEAAAPTGGLLPDDLADSSRMRALLQRVLDDMPDELREVFVLFELEEFTRSELVRILGLPAGTVASRLHRAREVFQAACAKLGAVRQGGKVR
ncbi:MAG: sigma-70 family RNA polymerase sigma factor [Polyangiaceae bacterium]|nr:sigma-70 family RNA polymerase sigma factor [Polyangiaceae bacterium]